MAHTRVQKGAWCAKAVSRSEISAAYARVRCKMSGADQRPKAKSGSLMLMGQRPKRGPKAGALILMGRRPKLGALTAGATAASCPAPATRPAAASWQRSTGRRSPRRFSPGRALPVQNLGNRVPGPWGASEPFGRGVLGLAATIPGWPLTSNMAAASLRPVLFSAKRTTSE